MLTNFPLDIIYLIIMNVNSVHDIIGIIISNKYLYINIDDSYFLAWAIKQYSKEFWIKAKNRSKSISKPLKSMKFELIRLENFIDTIKKQNIKWSNKDFYDFWNMLEEEKNKKNKNIKNYLYL